MTTTTNPNESARNRSSESREKNDSEATRKTDALTIELAPEQLKLLSEKAAILRATPAELLAGSGLLCLSMFDGEYEPFMVFSEAIRVFAQNGAVPMCHLDAAGFEGQIENTSSD